MKVIAYWDNDEQRWQMTKGTLTSHHLNELPSSAKVIEVSREGFRQYGIDCNSFDFWQEIIKARYEQAK